MIPPEIGNAYLIATKADCPQQLDRINDLFFVTFAMRFAARRLDRDCRNLLDDRGLLNPEAALLMLKDVSLVTRFIQRMPIIARDLSGKSTRSYSEIERAGMYRDVANLLRGRQDEFQVEEIKIEDRVKLDRNRVSSFCHDLNNPVTSINAWLQMLNRRGRGIDPRPWALKVRADVRNLKRATSRAEMRLLGLPEDASVNIVEAVDILSDSFPVDFNLGSTDKIIGDEKLDRLFKSKITVEGDLSNVRMAIPADRFAQISTNIAQNAERAFARRTWRRKNETRMVEISIKAAGNGNFVEIKFKDNACGFPKDILNQGYKYGLSYQGGKGIGMVNVVEYIRSINGKYEVKNIFDNMKQIDGSEQTILLPTQNLSSKV